MSQPFPNPAKNAHERFDKHLDKKSHHLTGDTFAPNPWVNKSQLDTRLAIPIHDKWFVHCMFMTCYHVYAVPNWLASYIILSCRDLSPRQPFINIQVIVIKFYTIIVHLCCFSGQNVLQSEREMRNPSSSRPYCLSKLSMITRQVRETNNV